MPILASRSRSAVSTVREPRSFGSSGLPRSLREQDVAPELLDLRVPPGQALDPDHGARHRPGDPVQVGRVLDLVALDRDRLAVAQVPAEPRGQVRQQPVVDRVDVVEPAQPGRPAPEVVEAGAEEIDEPPQLAVLGRGLRDGARVARRPLRDVVAADDRRQQVVEQTARAVHLGRDGDGAEGVGVVARERIAHELVVVGRPGIETGRAILDVEDLLQVADRVSRGVEGHGPGPPQHLDGDAVDLARHRLGRGHRAGAALDRLAEVDLGHRRAARRERRAVVDEERVVRAGVGELEVALLAAEREPRARRRDPRPGRGRPPRRCARAGRRCRHPP